MTTIDAAAAMRVRKAVTLSALAAFIGLGLGGCGTSASLFGNSDEAPAATATAPQAPAPAQVARMSIAPIIGPTEAVAKQLQAQLSAAMEKQQITVAKSPTDKSEYVVRGYFVSNREQARTRVAYIWDITDPAGTMVKRISGDEVVTPAQGKDTWSAITPQVVDSIVGKTVGPIVAWLPKPTQAGIASSAGATGSTGTGGAGAGPAIATITDVPGAQQTPQKAPQGKDEGKAAAAGTTGAAGTTTGSIDRKGGVTAVLQGVSGAPGDGSVSLTSAMQRELQRNGVALTDKPGDQTYRIEAKVVVGESKDGKQPVVIVWEIWKPDGKTGGNVKQDEFVPQGTFDGAWGKTADSIAAAAAPGIVSLLPAAAVTKTN